jgi:hypothetical protein
MGKDILSEASRMTSYSTYGRGNQVRLHVVAPSVIDAVRCAGGWIFDYVRTGWTVSVVIPDRFDERPLRILGAEILDLDAVLARVDVGPSAALAVASELFYQDEEVEQFTRVVLAHPQTELLMWGEVQPAELGQRLWPVDHHLSSAAGAFKAQALRAASADPGVGERLQRRRWNAVGDREGVPRDRARASAA